MPTFIKRLACGLLALMLGACAAPPGDRETLWARHEARVAKFDHWRLSGKVALRSGLRSGSARLNWQQHPSAQTLELYANFGRHLRLSVDAGGAELQDSRGEHYSAPNLEDLLARNTEWPLPGAPLAYWVRGLPAPGGGELTFDPSGRLRHLRQFGWRVDYDDYRATASTPALPHRLDLRQIDGDAAREVKLIIWHWEIAPDG